MSNVFGTVFLIGVAVAVIFSCVQLLRDRKKHRSVAENALDSTEPFPIGLHESVSAPPPDCAHHIGHSDYGGDQSCGDFGGGHHH
jgi:MFS superfamily sulfate permease-like transporter